MTTTDARIETPGSRTPPAGLPDPLPEPPVEELRLEVVMGALSDPLRLTIVRKLMLESQAYDHTCGWFGFDRPKSSLTYHFKTLRAAGLIRQRQYGLERRSRVRTEDLDQRFPGLLALVAATSPVSSTASSRQLTGGGVARGRR
jgi:DNA-binding transcriptional ArsR family regulator